MIIFVAIKPIPMRTIVTSILILAITLPFAVVCHGGNFCIKSNHWPSDGDKLRKTHYEFVNIANDTLVWDFSGAIEAGGSHVMQLVNIGDSIIVKRELGGQSTYTVQNDSILWKTFENPFLKLCDSISPVLNTHNINPECSVRPYAFQGSYCENNHVSCYGNYSSNTSNEGVLILPNDTIENAVCFTLRFDGNMKVSNDKNPFSTDSMSTSKQIQHITVIDKWFSPDYKYELAENITDIYLFNNEPVSESYATFLSYEDQVSVMDKHNTSNRLTRKSSLPNDSKSNWVKTEDAQQNDVNISFNGKDIVVSIGNVNSGIFRKNADKPVSALLCDQLGRVWKVFAEEEIEYNLNEFRLSSEGLPQGYYILNIKIGINGISKKIIIE